MIMGYPLWTDDLIWNETTATWTGVLEVVAERYYFTDTRRKQKGKHTSNKQNSKTQTKEEEQSQYITLICVVDDERFEHLMNGIIH